MQKDMKESLSSARKPPVELVGRALVVYASRAYAYGGAKYELGNHRRPTGGAVHTSPTAADVLRFLGYLGAAERHIAAIKDSVMRHRATDPTFADLDGAARAVFAEDTDHDQTGKVGPSRLPHIAGAIASIGMLLDQAADCGLLPADPGQPWEGGEASRPRLDDRPVPLPTWRKLREGEVLEIGDHARDRGAEGKIDLVDMTDPVLTYRVSWGGVHVWLSVRELEVFKC